MGDTETPADFWGLNYVYCHEHVTAHRNGRWCTAPEAQKRLLNATTFIDACNEAEALGYRIGT